MNFKSTVIILSTVIFLAPLSISYADYDSFTVNVPNTQGGYTALVIKQSGQGYTGPQGEYYSSFPSVVQLQAVYGLNTPSPAVPAPAPATVTYTYTQPQVQWVVDNPVVNQEPVEDYNDADQGYPIDRANITEISAPHDPNIEYSEWVIFKPHKKDKDKNKDKDKPKPQAGPQAQSKPPVKTPASPNHTGKPPEKPHDHDKKPDDDKSN